jgi:hypothetical protein
VPAPRAKVWPWPHKTKPPGAAQRRVAYVYAQTNSSQLEARSQRVSARFVGQLTLRFARGQSVSPRKVHIMSMKRVGLAIALACVLASTGSVLATSGSGVDVEQ